MDVTTRPGRAKRRLIATLVNAARTERFQGSGLSCDHVLRLTRRDADREAE